MFSLSSIFGLVIGAITLYKPDIIAFSDMTIGEKRILAALIVTTSFILFFISLILDILEALERKESH